MSIRHMKEVFALDLPSGPKFVLLALADRADDAGNCHPGQEDIARRTGLCVRAVQKHLAWLIVNGHLQRRRRYRESGYRTSDAYRIVFPAASAPEPVSRETQDAGFSHENNAGKTVEKAENPNLGADNSCENNSHEKFSGENSCNSYPHKMQGNGEIYNNSLYPSEEPPERNTSAATEEDFEKFWQAYPQPRRGARAEVRRLWREALLQPGVCAANIQAGVEAYAASDEVRRGFVQLPVNWLRGEGWRVVYCPVDAPPAAQPPEPLPEWQQKLCRRGVHESEIRAYFRGAVLEDGRLIFPQRFQADAVRRRYEQDIRAVLGDVVMESVA